MMKVLAVASQKGGVSKTTLAVHLAATFARTRRVALIDRDSQQSSFVWGSSLEIPSLSLNGDIARPLLEVLQESANSDNEIAIIDCPPGIGGAFRDLPDVADLVLIPTRPSMLDLRALANSYHELRRKKDTLPCYVILTQVDDRHRATREVIQALEEAKIPMLGGRLHRLNDYSYAAAKGAVSNNPEVEQIAQEVYNLMAAVGLRTQL